MAMTTTQNMTPAEKIRTRFSDLAAAIRGRQELTPDAQRVLHARNYTDAKSQMSALRDGDADDKKSHVAKMTRQAFGIDDLTKNGADASSTAISSRDAQDRVEQIQDPKAALALLSRAEQSGDETLARAIGQLAFNRSAELVANKQLARAGDWDDVLQEFAGDRAPQAQAINALRAMPPDRSLANRFFAYSLPPPAELSGLGDGQIAALADSMPEVQ